MKSFWIRTRVMVLIAVLITPLNPILSVQAVSAKGLFAQTPPAIEKTTGIDSIIVKFKAAEPGTGSPQTAGERVQALSSRAGIDLRYFRRMSGGADVVRLPERLSLEQAWAISRTLMELSEVEYAEPDLILKPVLTPNDPQYGAQWHYYDTWGINIPAAWDLTTGSSDIVVAVIDTGVTNHADLRANTLSGYDFISDVWTANDGNGRDHNPSDPGDWVQANACGIGFPSQDSSWHGTHVAGTIGAATNNGLGVAGINWNSKILPVRVLGRCGGSLSDLADAMRWAAGLTVPGVPANPNPARVINLSLGGPGPCETTLQNTINNVMAAGAVVVAAAGNELSDASGSTPANCSGVITVAATDESGDMAFYSNYGSTVEISAPGGGLFSGVLSTSNAGTTTPASDTYVYNAGTSMAAPHVSGVVSLMLARDPLLTPGRVLLIIQNTAKPFPSNGLCELFFSCGAGIVNAGAAVAAVTVQTFADVPMDHWAWDYVERLYSNGITEGCTLSPLQYCPDGIITRAQMAVFLLRGLHGSAYTPPSVGGSTGFEDVPVTHFAAPWIKQLAAEGITTGCGSGNYCPESPVNRAQMAVFLLRASHGAGYTPPYMGGSTSFGDVPSDHWAAAWIKQLVTEGITAGCGNGNYCPAAPVTRAQMAVFLVKIFNLP